MNDDPADDAPATLPFVSTGHLPPPDLVTALVREAHARFADDRSGHNSTVYPALAAVPADLFGLCVVGTDGGVYAVGDADYPFAIMSVSKPFLFALVCDAMGAAEARDRLGVNATGRWRGCCRPSAGSTSIRSRRSISTPGNARSTSAPRTWR